MEKIPVITVAGPTASGKTALSIALAKHFDTEIISADSMQIYKYMNIGTAKPTKEEMNGIVHHMLDCVEPDEMFSVADWARMAHKHIENIYKSGRIPIIVGGTGLYIDNVLNNISLAEAQTDIMLRQKLVDEAELMGNEYMYKKLIDIDHKAAKNIHPNNIKRVIRALEVYYTTGNTFSHQIENSKNKPSPYESLIFMLNWDRDVLYERIDKRVDIMVSDGLYDEFLSLAKAGYNHRLNSMQAIGYKELFYYYRGLSNFDEAISMIKKHSRNYAKRQLTWFKKNDSIIKLDASDKNVIENCINISDKWLKSIKQA